MITVLFMNQHLALSESNNDQDYLINSTAILQVALQQGIWAALYIYLFFRMLKENAEREAKYQSMIDTLSGTLLWIRNCYPHYPLTVL